MALRPTLVLLMAACTLPPDPAPTTPPASEGTASGSVELPDRAFEVIDGFAYFDSSAHPRRVAVRLTSFELAPCVLEGTGEALEAPVDAGDGIERGSLWSCEAPACRSTDYPLVDVSLTEVGQEIGDLIVGTLVVLDDLDQPAGELSFSVPYCGRL